MTEFEFERGGIDMCEQGLRHRLADAERRAVGDEVEGIVRVKRSDQMRVLGTVVRIEGREIALRLSVGVPLRVVRR